MAKYTTIKGFLEDNVGNYIGILFKTAKNKKLEVEEGEYAFVIMLCTPDFYRGEDYLTYPNRSYVKGETTEKKLFTTPLGKSPFHSEIVAIFPNLNYCKDLFEKEKPYLNQEIKDKIQNFKTLVNLASTLRSYTSSPNLLKDVWFKCIDDPRTFYIMDNMETAWSFQHFIENDYSRYKKSECHEEYIKGKDTYSFHLKRVPPSTADLKSLKNIYVNDIPKEAVKLSENDMMSGGVTNNLLIFHNETIKKVSPKPTFIPKVLIEKLSQETRPLRKSELSMDFHFPEMRENMIYLIGNSEKAPDNLKLKIQTLIKEQLIPLFNLMHTNYKDKHNLFYVKIMGNYLDSLVDLLKLNLTKTDNEDITDMINIIDNIEKLLDYYKHHGIEKEKKLVTKLITDDLKRELQDYKEVS